MDNRQERVDAIRRRRSELDNHLIDEYQAGKISRREFVRRGTVVGMSIPVVGFLASACGGGDDEGGASTEPTEPGAASSQASTSGAAAAGGTIRTALISPTAALDPITVADEGGLAVLGQAGEYLTWSNAELGLEPRIAESWTPNEDGSVWSFTIRQGVTYHDGTPLTAEDVAATMDRLADPDVGSNALSVFGGVLSKGNIKAMDDATVEFTLDAPNGNFPYLVSSDNYNSIILPAAYAGDWETTFIGAGPWKLESYTAGAGVTFVRNPDYWGARREPLAERGELKL